MKKTTFSTKTMSICLALCLVLSVFSCLMAIPTMAESSSYSIATSYAGGTGTKDDPYQITNASELAKMVNGYGRVDGTVTGAPAYFKLMNDIDLNPTDNWAPNSANTAGYVDWKTVDQKYTSSNTQPFVGHLDGNGKIISHMYVNTGLDYNHHAALIQNFDISASVKNLTIKDFYSCGTFAAGVAALDRNLVNGTPADVNFENITVKNGFIINEHDDYGASGAIIARAADTANKMVIRSCNAYDVHLSRKTTKTKVGAIVGDGSGASVYDCTAKGCFGVNELKGAAQGNGSNGVFEHFYLDVNYASGSGTVNDPYHINNANQLLKMVRNGGVGADGTSKGYFVLDNDIVLNDSANWAPDKNNTKRYRNWSSGTTTSLKKFIGDFDGQYHTITGLYANNNHISDCNGFIHRTNGDVTIKNVTFKNSYVYGGKYVGAIIGYCEAASSTKLSQVMVIDATTSSGWGNTGGFVGEATWNASKSVTLLDCAAINVTARGIFIDATNTTPNVKLYGCWAAGCSSTNFAAVTKNVTPKNSYIVTDSASVQGDKALTSLPGIDFEYAWTVGEDTEYPCVNPLEISNVWDGNKTAKITDLDGEGTEKNPYKITNGAQLYAAVNTKNSSVYFSIENDIYLNDFRKVNSGYYPTTNDWFTANYEPFVGNINGNGHTIYGLYLKATGWSPVGLFNVVGMGATIKDITLDSATVTGNQYFTAGLIGRVTFIADTETSYTPAAVVDGCAVVNSDISATQASDSKRIGAVIGSVNATGGVKLNVINCYAAGNTLKNSYNKDNKDSFYGGIVGHVEDSGHIIYVDDCYSDGYPVIAAGSEDFMHKGININTIGDVYSVNMTETGFDGIYTDKYAVATYADMTGLFGTDSAWYQASGCAPRLVNRTSDFVYPDFDCDGIDEAPDSTSLAILRQSLLEIKGFNINNAIGNVNGDSSADGTIKDLVDIRDLIRLKKYLVGLDELKKKITTNYDELLLTTAPNLPNVSEYSLTWQDEFNAPVKIHNDYDKNWQFQWCIGWADDLELTRESENISVKSNGETSYLSMRAVKTGEDTYATAAPITTCGKMSYLYGYLEIKASVPYGQGMFPAFWLRSTNAQYPQEGNVYVGDSKLGYNNAASFDAEVDVFEVFGNKNITSNIHKYMKADGSHSQAANYSGMTSSFDISEGKVYNPKVQSWHTYGFEWTPDKMTMYIDGVAFNTFDLNKYLNGTSIGVDKSGFNSPLSVILNLSMFTEGLIENNDWLADKTPFDGSNYNINDVVGSFDVDYIRLYQKADGQLWTK